MLQREGQTVSNQEQSETQSLEKQLSIPLLPSVPCFWLNLLYKNNHEFRMMSFWETATLGKKEETALASQQALWLM